MFIQVIYAGNASNEDPEIIEECSRLEDVLGVEITSQESVKSDDDIGVKFSQLPSVFKVTIKPSFELAEGMGDEDEVDAPSSSNLEGEMFKVEEVTIDEPIEPWKILLQGSTRL